MLLTMKLQLLIRQILCSLRTSYLPLSNVFKTDKVQLYIPVIKN